MNELEKIITDVNSFKVDDNTYKSLDWLSILFNRFSKLKYHSWVEGGLYSDADVRPMVFFRIESSTLWYEQNIISSVSSSNEFIECFLKHGYSNEFTAKHISILRETHNRAGFLDSIYFSIDYFISKISEIHKIKQPGQGKVKHFSNLLEYFDMLNSGERKNKIMIEFMDLLPKEMNESRDLFIDRNENKITYLKIFEYLTLIRNSLHNNGFSSKELPNLVIGPIKFTEVKKGKRINFASLPQIIFLFVQIINVLEMLCEKSVNEVSTEIKDLHLESIEEELSKSASHEFLYET